MAVRTPCALRAACANVVARRLLRNTCSIMNCKTQRASNLRAPCCMESHEDSADMPAASAAAPAAQSEQHSGAFAARAEPDTFWTADAVKRLVSLHAGNTPQMLQQLAQGLQHGPELHAAFSTAELQCAHSGGCDQPAAFGHLEGVGTLSAGPRYCDAHKLAGMINVADRGLPSMTSASSPLLPSAAYFAENLEGHAGSHWMTIGAAGGRSSSSRASPTAMEGSATYMGALPVIRHSLAALAQRFVSQQC
jgi:hypothetical protein